MPTVVNLDGLIVPPAEARVSVFDRGFLYGDSVYEVIRTYGGRPFELEAHLRRLEGSAARIGLELPWEAARTTREIARSLEASRDPARGADPEEPDAAPWNPGERYVRVVMTRGAGELGLDPALAVDPRAIVIARPVHGPPLEAYRRGVKAWVVGMEHVPARAMDPAAKTGNYLHSVLAVREARAAGAHEAILLDAGGHVTEGSTSNVFWVRGGRLETPPVEIGILEGVTRGVVVALAREAGVPLTEVRVPPDELAAADEVFITSTVRELVPVTALGDRLVGSGTPGPVWARLHALFRARAEAGAR
jgi:branched-chain amino acid aminotransferase